MTIHNYKDFDETQNFETIKKTHSLKNRFTDNKFPANDSSLGYSNEFVLSLKARRGPITWKRAKDLHPKAQFALRDSNDKFEDNVITKNNYKEFYKTTDIHQGSLGNVYNFLLIENFISICIILFSFLILKQEIVG